MVEACYESKKAGLREGRKLGEWLAPLRNHVLPIIGEIPIAEMTQFDVARGLEKVWAKKPETARKAAIRLGQTLTYAAAHGLKVQKDAVEMARPILGERRKSTAHVPSMPWQDCPVFFQTLNTSAPVEAMLGIVILSACRSKDARFARWTDIRSDLWTVPGGVHKSGADFEIPVTAAMQEILNNMRALAGEDDLVFPSVRGKPLSDMAMTMAMKRAQLAYRPHGFRASFRTWAGESGQERELAELSLGHKFGSDVEIAYRRGTILNRRRVLMERWAGYLTGVSGDIFRLAQDG